MATSPKAATPRRSAADGASSNGHLNGNGATRYAPLRVKLVHSLPCPPVDLNPDPVQTIGALRIAQRIPFSEDTYTEAQVAKLHDYLATFPEVRAHALRLPLHYEAALSGRRIYDSLLDYSSAQSGSINDIVDKEQLRLLGKAAKDSELTRTQLQGAEQALADAGLTSARAAADVSAITDKSPQEIINEARSVLDSSAMAATQAQVSDENDVAPHWFLQCCSYLPVVAIGAAMGIIVGDTFEIIDLTSLAATPIFSAICMVLGVSIVLPYSIAVESLAKTAAKTFYVRDRARWAVLAAMGAAMAAYLTLSGCVVYHGIVADQQTAGAIGSLGLHPPGTSTASTHPSEYFDKLAAFAAALIMDFGVTVYKAATGWAQGSKHAHRQLTRCAIDYKRQERWDTLEASGDMIPLRAAISIEVDCEREVDRLRNEIERLEKPYRDRVEELENRRRIGGFSQDDQRALKQTHVDMLAAVQAYLHALDEIIEAIEPLPRRVLVMKPAQKMARRFWDFFKLPGRRKRNDAESFDGVRVYTLH